ncbi:MAG TPA: polysaccharide deacetylase family protein [Chitinophagaceae bacterium]
MQYIVGTLLPGAAVTSSLDEYLQFAGTKINYSSKRFSDSEFHLKPHGLLSEAGIRQQKLRCTEWEGLKIFFNTIGDFPFDVFAAAFYLLTRYEEYLPHRKDSYGRYAHTESLAFREGFLHLPLVDLWAESFYRAIKQVFVSFTPPAHSFRFIPTYDIDIAYSVKGSGPLRQLYAMVRNRSFGVKGKDVFDIYGWLDQLHEDADALPIYFFLLAARRSKYDKNRHPRSASLRRLIQEVATKYRIGLHPSWQSHDDAELVQSELLTLEEISGRKTVAARQHYIRLTLPATYRNYIGAGIAEDYSMGYGSINGFRASSCRPFFWYDLIAEQTTSLQIHPFCFMDANASFEEGLDAPAALKCLLQYRDIVRSVNGELITIFHNHFLTEQPQWQRWREMYKQFIAGNFVPNAALTFPSQPAPL